MCRWLRHSRSRWGPWYQNKASHHHLRSGSRSPFRLRRIRRSSGVPRPPPSGTSGKRRPVHRCISGRNRPASSCSRWEVSCRSRWARLQPGGLSAHCWRSKRQERLAATATALKATAETAVSAAAAAATTATRRWPWRSPAKTALEVVQVRTSASTLHPPPKATAVVAAALARVARASTLLILLLAAVAAIRPPLAATSWWLCLKCRHPRALLSRQTPGTWPLSQLHLLRQHPHSKALPLFLLPRLARPLPWPGSTMSTSSSRSCSKDSSSLAVLMPHQTASPEGVPTAPHSSRKRPWLSPNHQGMRLARLCSLKPSPVAYQIILPHPRVVAGLLPAVPPSAPEPQQHSSTCLLGRAAHSSGPLCDLLVSAPLLPTTAAASPPSRPPLGPCLTPS